MTHNAHRLLIVEDDKNQGFLLHSHLKSVGFESDLAVDGEEGLKLFSSHDYALCILDIMMPKLDGIALVKKMNVEKQTPFIFLSARNLKIDKLMGYELGCEDYITKPFDIDLLVHKINAILKRTSGRVNDPKNTISIGKLELNIIERTVRVDHKIHQLTHKEANLIKLLLENYDQAISRRQMMIETWGNDDFFTSKSLDVHLTRVRKLLHSDSGLKLNNIHGYGYRLTQKLAQQ